MVDKSAVSDYSSALIEGPWRHEFVAASGTRLHLAISGPPRAAEPDQTSREPASGKPLVVLLHGAGQFWWAWRTQIPALAEAGYPVAALDLRGVAASDKPPNGYDIPTRTRDVAAVIRALGYDRAIIVGHSTGAETAWAMPALQPGVTCAVAALSSPHPARVHVGLARFATPAARRLLTLAQVPMLPERRLRETDLVSQVLSAGAKADFPAEVLDVYETVIRIPFAAHTSAEPLRWLVRSRYRNDGLRYRAAVRTAIDVPVLQVQGSADGFIRPNVADLDSGAFTRQLRFEMLDDVGHYLPEEAPEQVTELLLDWLAEVTTA